ncbi:MAG: DUF434 domain-containing protein [Bacteroidales bacterium]|nr:DUF434 domain-containing protein [Bacteroidales bacterium]
MNLTNSLQQAIFDYKYLLSKNYPPKSSQKLIGDRYKLSGAERAILYRGMTTTKIAQKRRSKKIETDSLKGKTILIDTLNQLFTLSAYLLGKPVFISTDGFLRDALELHGSGLKEEIIKKSVKLVFEYINTSQIKNVMFYLDEQVDTHQIIVRRIEDQIAKSLLQAKIITSNKVDKTLCSFKDKIISSSDSVIIERTGSKIFDLAQTTLLFHFKPDFIDLGII